MTIDAQERRAPLVADGLAVVAIGLAGLTAIVTFLPTQGFIATPMRDGLSALFGRATFAIPLVLLLGGVVRLAHGNVPRTRLAGLGLLLVSVPIAEHLLAFDDAGLAGRVLANVLLDAVGGVGAWIIVVCGVGLGAALTFGARLGQK